MASRTIPIEGVTPFEVDDTKNDEDVEREEDVPSCAGELEGTDSDQGLGPHVPGGTSENNSDQGFGPHVPGHTSENNSDQGMEPHVPGHISENNSDQEMEPHVPGHTSENNSDQGLEPKVPTENCSVVTEGDISLSCSTAREGNPFYDSTSPASTLDFLPDSSRTCFTDTVCDDTVPFQTHSVQPPDKESCDVTVSTSACQTSCMPELMWKILLSILFFTFSAILQVDMPPLNNIRGQPSSHQPHKMFLNDSSAYSSLHPDSPRIEMDEENIRRGIDVQLANDTIQNQRCEPLLYTNETEQPVPENNLHPVNGTANESYMTSMLRQESRWQDSQHFYNMEHFDAVETGFNSEEQPIDEARSIDQFSPNSTTRPPEGVAHGGLVSILDRRYRLRNTCNLDQFLNGLFLICCFLPFLQLLKELAETFPDSYRHLLDAVLHCREGCFAEAKFGLVPYTFDMLNSEGRRVMPLIEQQLCHRFHCYCERCHVHSTAPEQFNVCLKDFNPLTGFQEAFRSYFYGHGVCTQEGCGGRTIRRPIFTTGTPPLILAVNLISLHHLIPNSQVVDDGEILELFGERYMMFIFSIARHGDLNLQIPGHYMSRCFRPAGGADSQGIPIGEWVFYPNNQSGSLYPWTTDQRDPDGTFPSYVYFIRIPAPREAATCTGEGEEESPQSDNNEDVG